MLEIAAILFYLCGAGFCFVFMSYCSRLAGEPNWLVKSVCIGLVWPIFLAWIWFTGEYKN